MTGVVFTFVLNALPTAVLPKVQWQSSLLRDSLTQTIVFQWGTMLKTPTR